MSDSQAAETGRDGVSVVVPVYRSAATLPELVERIGLVLSPLGPHEIVLVDDGSLDGSWRVIQELATKSDVVRGIRLSRNFGQHCALVAGMRAVQYPVTVTLDDDLQNPPEEIPLLLDALAADPEIDVVYGATDIGSQGIWRRIASRISRASFSTALGVETAARMSPFRALRTKLRDAFAGDVGPNVSLDAMLAWGTSSFSSVDVRHDSRKGGKSTYSFLKLLRFSIDMATGYSTLPLQVATVVGLLASAFGVVILGYVVIVSTMAGSVPGFPFLAAIIAIFAGTQLFSIGIIGEYLARMHFRIMKKPTYFVGSTTDGPAAEPAQAGQSR